MSESNINEQQWRHIMSLLYLICQVNPNADFIIVNPPSMNLIDRECWECVVVMGIVMFLVGFVDRLVSSTMTSVATTCLAVIKMTTLMMTTLRTMDGNCFTATFSAFLRIALCSVQYLVRCTVIIVVIHCGMLLLCQMFRTQTFTCSVLVYQALMSFSYSRFGRSPTRRTFGDYSFNQAFIIL